MKTEKLTRTESLRLQKELGKKVTAKMLDNEHHRFCTMEMDQLVARLKKIKNPLKAEACRQMAKICEEKKLVRAARRRRNELSLAA
ncbi:hypothetical protein DRH13_05900 [Candidatus Woesebacteria bacterium]|nr:MAG: hypothetical protein DRH13_05900 [Candidatus Woesebacteria bacterium]